VPVQDVQEELLRQGAILAPEVVVHHDPSP
jgi:hypothetical protein